MGIFLYPKLKASNSYVIRNIQTPKKSDRISNLPDQIFMYTLISCYCNFLIKFLSYLYYDYKMKGVRVGIRANESKTHIELQHTP